MGPDVTPTGPLHMGHVAGSGKKKKEKGDAREKRTANYAFEDGGRQALPLGITLAAAADGKCVVRSVADESLAKRRGGTRAPGNGEMQPALPSS